MQYEIHSIEPIQGDRDLLLELWHWHDDTPIGSREPDFKEHVRLLNIPRDEIAIRTNNLGQYIRSDGYPENPYKMIDNQWVFWRPGPGDPNYIWDGIQVDSVPDVIVSAVEDRSRDVKSKNIRNKTDFFQEDKRPSISNKPNHIGRRPDVVALRRTRGVVQ